MDIRSITNDRLRQDAPAFEMTDFKAFFPHEVTTTEVKNSVVWHSKHMSMKTGKYRNVKATISFYIVVEDIAKNETHRFYSKPSEELIAWIKANMVHVKYDTIYFQIIVGKDFCTLRAHYNQIIGSRLIADLTRESVPLASK